MVKQRTGDKGERDQNLNRTKRDEIIIIRNSETESKVTDKEN